MFRTGAALVQSNRTPLGTEDRPLRRTPSLINGACRWQNALSVVELVVVQAKLVPERRRFMSSAIWTWLRATCHTPHIINCALEKKFRSGMDHTGPDQEGGAPIW